MTTLAALASCGGLKKAQLQSLTISGPPSVRVGTSVQFAPTFVYPPPRGPSNKPAVDWQSSDVTIATIGRDGVATGVKPGVVTISGTALDAKGRAKTGTATLTVTLDAQVIALSIEPATPTLTLNQSLNMVARAMSNDGTRAVVTDSVDWTSSDPTVVRVTTGSTARGRITGIKVGTAKLTATLGALTAETTVTVTAATIKSIAVTPNQTTSSVGVPRNFVATALLSDDTNVDITQQASWTAAPAGVATISNTDGSRGRATPTAMGTANITATYMGVTSAPARLTVTAIAALSVQVTPAMPVLPKGAVQALVATATFPGNTTQDVTGGAAWTSSASAVATVAGDGTVTAIAPGTATITATFGAVMGTSLVTVTNASLSSIEVTPPGQTLARGLGQLYTATGVYSDGTRRNITAEVTWSTVNPAVAAVSNATGSHGLLTAVAAGTTMVTASLEGKVGAASVTVSQATLSVLSVSPSASSVGIGGRVTYEARGLFSDGSNRDLTSEVTWTSSNQAVASISNADGSRGYASALTVGTTSITATLDGLTDTATLTVTNATVVSVSITPVSRTLAIGTSGVFTATAVYSDNTQADVTELADWTSSVLATATASSTAGSRGRVTAVAVGTSSITATYSGKAGTATVTVSNATLTSLSISPTNRSVARDSIVIYSASGVFSDNTTQDLSDQVGWASSMPAVATISNADPTRGHASTLSPGTTSISATFGAVSAATNLVVTNATLTGIVVAPATSKIAATTQVALSATGTYSDASTQDLGALVFWASSNDTIATVSNGSGTAGDVLGIAPGTVNISAVLGTVSGSASVEVTSATLTSLSVTPPAPTVAFNTTQQFQATGNFSDNTTQDLTWQVTWSTSNPALAVISNVRSNAGEASALAPGTVTVTAAFGSVTGNATLTITNSVLASIQVTPANVSIAKGTTRQFTATGVFSDSSQQNLTSSVTWSTSGMGAVATVSNGVGTHGLVNGVAEGTATVTATLGAISGNTPVTVTAATLSSLAITPANPSVAMGSSLQFTVTGSYSDGNTQNLTDAASWTSSDLTVATITTSGSGRGLAATNLAGVTTITATADGQTATTTLTVTAKTLTAIALSLTNPSLAKGLTLNFSAQGTYSDMSTQDITTAVTWGSSNTAVATVSNASGSEGRATAAGLGTSTISAQLAGVTGSTTMTVTAATLASIEVTPPAPAIPNGSTQQFTATGVYSDSSTQPLTTAVTWTAINPMGTTVASVSSAMGSEGLATAQTAGVATIRATLGAVSGDATLTVTAATLTGITLSPLNSTLPLGAPLTFAATGLYTDSSSAPVTSVATWSSSDTNIASISNASGQNGQITTVATGTVTITATIGAVTASTMLTISPAMVATISITPANSQIATQTMMQMTAIATYTDGQTTDITGTATWGSSTGAAAFGTPGIVTGTGVGMTVISASFGGQTGTTNLTVSNATIVLMAVTPGGSSLAAGSSAGFVATGTFSDATTQDLNLQATWASSNTSVASISNAPGTRGVAQGLAAGSTTISAVWNGVGGSTALTVTPAILQSITVTPASVTAAVGTTRRFTATGNYSDNSTAVITQDVTWSVVGSGATIDNASGVNKGVATATAVGSPTIKAALSGVEGTTTLVVTGSTITSIVITPGVLSMPAGTSASFTATANLSGGGSQDITDQVTWGSSNPARVTISNTDPTRGLASGQTPGASTITAIFNGQVSANFPTATVTAATLQSIAITPAASSLPKGIAVQYTALGTYSDGSSVNLSDSVTWASSGGGVTISNAGGSEGLAQTPGIGVVTISATLGGVTGNTDLTVTAAALQSITVTPANGNLAIAGNQQFVATGNYSDGPQILTTQVTWASSNAGVATISNAGGSKGLATGVANGTTTISAIFEGISGSTGLSVP
jgi:uncharacterized protein YjdB